MNVFIPFSDTHNTAKTLDRLRLNKQIIECDTMLSAIKDEKKAWRRHPATLMYQDYIEWLEWYRDVLFCHRYRLVAPQEPERPPFIGDEEIHRAHRARLFQKNPIHYAQFAGDNDFTIMNWYVVDGYLLKYKDGRLIEKSLYKF